MKGNKEALKKFLAQLKARGFQVSVQPQGWRVLEVEQTRLASLRSYALVLARFGCELGQLRQARGGLCQLRFRRRMQWTAAQQRPSLLDDLGFSQELSRPERSGW
jgi:hypothetical protein